MKLHIELGATSCQCELTTISEDDARKLVALFFSRMVAKDRALPALQYDIFYKGHEEGKKLDVIRAIRSLAGLPLRESKEASERPGSVLSRVPASARDEWLRTLRDAGAEVEARAA